MHSHLPGRFSRYWTAIGPPSSILPTGSDELSRVFDFFRLCHLEMPRTPRIPRRIPPRTPTAIPTLAPVVNPGSSFDFVSLVSASDGEPKPSFIVLLSRTVNLQKHNWPRRDDGLLLYAHESINVQRDAGWVADSDLMFPGCVKPGARVRNKLGPLRFSGDSKTSCLGLTVDRYLESVWVG